MGEAPRARAARLAAFCLVSSSCYRESLSSAVEAVVSSWVCRALVGKTSMGEWD